MDPTPRRGPTPDAPRPEPTGPPPAVANPGWRWGDPALSSAAAPSPSAVAPPPPRARPDALPVEPVTEHDGGPGLGPLVAMLGLVLVVVLLVEPRWALFLTPVALVVLLLAHRVATLRRRQVIDRWDALLLAAHGQGERVVGQTVATLAAWQIPAIAHRRVALAPGVLRGLAGDTRPFLVVAHTQNPRLKPFKLYVTARDYGTTLQASWYLAYQPSVWRRVRPVVAPVGLGLDLFDEQDLRAYVTAVHHAFLDAVVELLTTLGQDASRLERSSKGFLGIS